jgi:hypothetical protein
VSALYLGQRVTLSQILVLALAIPAASAAFTFGFAPILLASLSSVVFLLSRAARATDDGRLVEYDSFLALTRPSSPPPVRSRCCGRRANGWCGTRLRARSRAGRRMARTLVVGRRSGGGVHAPVLRVPRDAWQRAAVVSRQRAGRARRDELPRSRRAVAAPTGHRALAVGAVLSDLLPACSRGGLARVSYCWFVYRSVDFCAI